MNFPKSRFTYVTAALVMGLSLLLGACGGGSGTGSSDTTGPTGNVAVLLTDAPTLLYDEIHVTITGIVLLPREDASDAEQVVLFEGEETIDILQLRDYADLFVVAEEVPIDDYEKVRLFISQVELVDNGTEPPSSVFATLPSGKIDLLPKEPLTVAEDQTLYLELDLDARNSLLITETGTGNLIFRPVVFVRVFEEDEGNGENGNGEENGLPEAVDNEEMETAGEDAPLLGVSGLVRLAEEDRVLVCPATAASETACVRLSLNDESPVFDTTGALVGPDALTEGARLIAMGLLERDPEDGRRVLEVLSITMGTRPTVGTRGGAAGGPVDENGHFVLRDGRTVALAPETPVVDNRGQPLGAEAIMDGQGLTFMGIVGGPSNPIPATLVILRGDDDDDDDGNGEAFGASPTNIRGELIAVENEDTLQVDVNGEVHWVQLEEGGQLVISGQGQVSDGALADLGDFDRVRIIAQGEQGESYFEAHRIVAITLGMNDQVVSDVGGGPPPHAGPPDHAGPPEHAGPPGSGD